MELRQMRYLVAIADEKQFTRAAAREHVAQPALSQQIARLEAELGVPLVQRSRQESTLTQAGALLAHRARGVLRELDAAGAELADLKGLRRGRISIGAMQTLGAFDLVALLSAYRRRYPDVSLFVREELSGSLAELLRGGRIDLSFLSVTEGFDSDGLELLQVAEEELVAVLPIAHPLAGRTRIGLADLAEEQFISFSEGSALRQLLVDAAADSGFSPAITVESNEIPRVRTMVAGGLGVAVLPRSAVTGPGPEVRLVGFTSRPWSWDVSLAWRRDRHLDPPAVAFLDMARGIAAE
jgi:LysR family transcriptional regulator, transcription activator of glutamate synthase operon